MSLQSGQDPLKPTVLDVEAELWHQAKAEVAEERGKQRHRASSDARLLQLTLQRIRIRPKPP